MRHVVIDLETLGTNPCAPIIAVGAIGFDFHAGIRPKIPPQPDPGSHFLPDYGRHGAHTSSFYCAVKPSLAPPFVPEFDTIQWWMSQSESARAVFQEKGEDATSMLQAFSRWLERASRKDRAALESPAEPVRIWGYSPRMDISILQHTMGVYGYPIPWDHHDVMDLRTLARVVDPSGTLRPDDTETPHHALQDAFWQASYLWRLLALVGDPQ